MIKLSLQKITLPGKFNIPDIECILVLDEGQALARAGLEILFYISILNMIIIDKIIDPKAKMSKLICLCEIVFIPGAFVRRQKEHVRTVLGNLRHKRNQKHAKINPGSRVTSNP